MHNDDSENKLLHGDPTTADLIAGPPTKSRSNANTSVRWKWFFNSPSKRHAWPITRILDKAKIPWMTGPTHDPFGLIEPGTTGNDRYVGIYYRGNIPWRPWAKYVSDNDIRKTAAALCKHYYEFLDDIDKQLFDSGVEQIWLSMDELDKEKYMNPCPGGNRQRHPGNFFIYTKTEESSESGIDG